MPMTTHPPLIACVQAAAPRSTWLDAYRAVRTQSEALAAPLSVEDQALQSMPDTSPTKWHLAQRDGAGPR